MLSKNLNILRELSERFGNNLTAVLFWPVFAIGILLLRPSFRVSGFCDLLLFFKVITLKNGILLVKEIKNKHRNDQKKKQTSELVKIFGSRRIGFD